MIKKYEVLRDSRLEPKAVKGSVVYDCMSHDYGVANDDTRVTGIKHASFTLDPNGGYPFFTMPLNSVKEIK